MSCWMLSEKRIAQLSSFLTTLYNAGFNYFGFDMPDDLREELTDCRDVYGFADDYKVFVKLYNFNKAAYEGRYPHDDEIDSAPDKMPEYEQIHKYRTGDILQWHYDILKLLNCFVYQCCEDATYNTPLYRALDKFSDRLASYIVASMPEYKTAVWG